MSTVANPSAVETPSQSTFWRVLLLMGGAAALVFYVVAIASIRVTTKVVEGPQPEQVTNKITETTQPLGDSVTSAVLGAAVLLLIAGAFYDRIKKITGPGGVVVEFDAEEKAAAAEAVVDELKDKPSPAKDALISAPSADDPKAVDATRDLSSESIRANLATLQEARDLLKVAHASPVAALKLCDEWGLPSDLSNSVVTNLRIPNGLWPALAKRAVR